MGHKSGRWCKDPWRKRGRLGGCRAMFSIRRFCPLGNIWQCLETFQVVTTWGEVLLALSGWRPGMQLNILWFTGQPCTMKSYPAQHGQSAKVEKSWHREGRDGEVGLHCV